MSGRRYRIVICKGPECGGQRGSEALHEVFRSAVEANQARDVEIAWQSCFGRCTQGPNVLVREIVDVKPASAISSVGLATMPAPRGTTALYSRMSPSEPERATTVIVQHVQGGQIVREYIERVGPAGIGPIDPLASRTKDR
ncbi:MAG TPA: (2Fe-2S) ferredoxin domain-containing protein [Kofleriaceae bacterium]|jgi:(2Fe-2S) ferredoxin